MINTSMMGMGLATPIAILGRHIIFFYNCMAVKIIYFFFLELIILHISLSYIVFLLYHVYLLIYIFLLLVLIFCVGAVEFDSLAAL